MIRRHSPLAVLLLSSVSIPAPSYSTGTAPALPSNVPSSKNSAFHLTSVRRRAEDAEQAEDATSTNTKCSKFLLSFLEGDTNADDTCEGIKDAYLAADCSVDDESYNNRNDDDDYFYQFKAHTCCRILQEHYTEYCRSDYMFTSMHLLFAMIVLLLSECAKNVMHRLKYLNFIPEAGICVLVGMVCGLVASLFPDTSIDSLSFDNDLFMSVLLPPIIFEAALAVSKTEFKRRRTAIMVFSVLGTLVSTFMTGLMVHCASMLTPESLPMLDSLVFGALISSIDPVAILSILTNLGLSQADTVFILVLGESLLNDGVAITVFKTLVARFDGRTNDGSTSASEVFGAAADFLIAMVGSIAVALACGCVSWFYFYYLRNTLSPAWEVGSFFIWALVPFYISESLQWSGIVSLVGMGFFMDIYIASPKGKGQAPSPMACCDYVEMGSSDDRSVATGINSIAPISGTSRLQLSSEAQKHIRFIAHVTAQLAESAIFAYLGLFLFSKNYDWDPALISIGIASCLMSRAFMVVLLSQFILLVYRMRGYSTKPQASRSPALSTVSSNESDNEICHLSKTAAAIRNPRTQTVLVLAGLRGAVSFALVENVPLYNALTEEGCQYKPLMKGMTSAAIIFTTFIIGGASYFLLPVLGFAAELKDDVDKASSINEAGTSRTIELADRKAGLEGLAVLTSRDTESTNSDLSILN
eukprot:CAMPEP_0178506508 /NCGR_PEP_ID=MMETSP0696-20121128/19713_1 /TAXON_ID=265572 /ORGANISM="Extubocellulus spinifer, Strain CCMP396" /LENGTH=698 /DNA_ID=CAMNT_0020135913 /DNA_START=105 /DNA_END=2201 /DNA_ORIENTATION=-